MNITINKKYIIKGILINKSPLLIGGGAIDKTKDVALVRDWQGKPYIPGTSLAGCLMNYFRERYDINNDLDFLWGQHKEKKYQAQLLIDDAYLSDDNYTIKIRDGVKIDNASGRAIEQGLYNYESLEPGAKFNFEAEITQRNESPVKFLNTFLKRFQKNKGTFQIGALSSFGFGKMSFESMEILVFEDASSWMKYLQTSVGGKPYEYTTESFYKSVSSSYLDIDVTLKQKTAFIARDYSQDLSDDLIRAIGAERLDKEDSSPDSITLLVNDQPVLSAKTLKGALRSQGATIINTILGFANESYKPRTNPHSILDKLFGKWIENPGDERQKTKSLLEIGETQISNVSRLQLHQRVSIDRFSGGAMESKLFNSVPVYPGENDITVNMRLKISNTDTETKAQLGLLLYILRDLNDKLFSVGGEKSIGRGLFDVLGVQIAGRDDFNCTIDFSKKDFNWGDASKSWIAEFHNQLKA